MSTANDIVRRALRAVGVLSAGKQPTGADAADGLEHLQSLMLGIPGLLANARWCEVAVTAAYTARESDRCAVSGSGAVTLPATVTDRRTGCARPPMDLARVQILGAVDNVGLWIYSATNAAWGKVTDLTLASTIPFGAEDDAGLAAMLAADIAPEYGEEAELGSRTAVVAQEAARNFRSRFKRTQPTDWSRPEPYPAADIAQDCDY